MHANFTSDKIFLSPHELHMEVADSDGCAVLLLVKLVLADDMNRRERREKNVIVLVAAAGQAGTPLFRSIEVT